MKKDVKVKEYPVDCFCGSSASLGPNSVLYNGKTYGNGMAYICDRFPDCRGSVGVHPNGKPLGTIPDDRTKKLRRVLHGIIDPLWQNRPYQQRRKARGQVYGWLRKIMDMTAEECHIGNFDAQTCTQALLMIEAYPFNGKKVIIGYDEFNNKETF